MKALRHVGIVVSDLSRSLHFYRHLLGLKIIKRRDESGKYIDTICGFEKTKVTTVKMAAKDGNLIELLYYHSLPGVVKRRWLNHIGISHIAFTVRNIDMEYRRLLKQGVKFNSPPQVSPDGYAKVAFCQDPDGVFIELVEVLKRE